MINAEALQLEGLRQLIQDLEWEISAQTDYVDHGRPAEKQSKQVIKLREQSKRARAALQTAIETVRREKPEAFAEWINYHRAFLERIQTENSTERNADTRRGMANFALQQWEKVAAGQQDFVYINQHFLTDYATAVKNQAPQVAAPEAAPSQVPGKGWWQFWK